MKTGHHTPHNHHLLHLRDGGGFFLTMAVFKTIILIIILLIIIIITIIDSVKDTTHAPNKQTRLFTSMKQSCCVWECVWNHHSNELPIFLTRKPKAKARFSSRRRDSIFYSLCLSLVYLEFDHRVKEEEFLSRKNSN